MYAGLRDWYDAQSDDPAEHSEWIQRSDEELAPCIYVQELVDANNNTPTLQQATEVIRVLRQYASGDDHFAKQNACLERKSRQVNSDEMDIKNGNYFFNGKRE